MNRREMAEEPSMEEILASIRKIIADEPTGETAFEARPLPRLTIPARDEAPRGGPAGNGTGPTTLSARLNNAFGSVDQPDARPPAPINRAALDDGLDDLLAEPPLARTATEVPKRSAPAALPVRPMPPMQATFSNKPPAPMAPTLQTVTPIEAIKPETWREPVAKPQPIVIAAMASLPLPEAPDTLQNPTPRAFSVNTMAPSARSPWPAPPQPEQQAPAQVELTPAAIQSGTSEARVIAGEQTTPAKGTAAPGDQLQPVVFAAMPPHTPPPTLTAPGAPPTQTNPAPPQGDAPVPPRAFASSPNVVSAAAEPSAIVTAPEPPPAWVPAPTAAAMAIGLDQTPQRGSDVGEPKPPTSDAVTSALEALAARLSVSPVSTSPEIVVAAVDVVTPQQPRPGPQTPAAAAPQPSPVSVFTSPDSFVGGVALTPMPVRTLDDTAAELLRPMLRHWLDENMPRIVEKALRIELAQAPLTPPEAGTKS